MNPIVAQLDPFGKAKNARAFADDVSAQDYMAVTPGAQLFRVESQLSDLGMPQLVAMYNALTGENLKKFSDKQTGVSRIVKATFMSDNTPSTPAHSEVDPNQIETGTDPVEQELGAANEPLEADENKATDPVEETGPVVPPEQRDTPTDADVTAEQAVAKAEADLAFDDGGGRIQAIREAAGEVSAQNPDGPVETSPEPGLPGETVAEAAAAATPRKRGGGGRKRKVVEGAEAAAPKPAKEPKAPKQPKPRDETKSRDRGINLTPRLPIRHARANSKQALLIDYLFKGTTLRELTEVLARTGKPWTPASIKTGFNWDVNHERGYGVSTTFTSDPEEVRQVDPVEADAMEAEPVDKRVARAIFRLVLPEGMDKPLPHTEPKTNKKSNGGETTAEAAGETDAAAVSESQETMADAADRSA